MSNKYLIKYNQLGGEYLDYYFYRLFSIFGDKNYKYKFAIEMINMIDSIVNIEDDQFTINEDNLAKIENYVSKISDNFKLKKEKNLFILSKTIKIFIEYINRLKNKYPSDITNFYNLEFRQLQNKLLIKDDKYIINKFIVKDYFKNNPIEEMYNLKNTDEKEKNSTYLSYINNLLKANQDELILNYNEEMLDRKIKIELYHGEYHEFKAISKYINIVRMFNSFIKYDDLKEYEKILKEIANKEQVINILNDSFNNDDNDGVKIELKKDKIKEIKGIKIEILDNSKFKIISEKQPDYDNTNYCFINLSQNDLNEIIQNIENAHEDFMKNLKLFYLDSDKQILYRKIDPIDMTYFVEELREELNEYQREEYNEEVKKDKNDIINNIVKNYEQRYDANNKYQQKLNEFENKYINILENKLEDKKREIELDFSTNLYTYSNNDLKIGDNIKIYEKNDFFKLKSILNMSYQRLINRYISEDTPNYHHKIKFVHSAYFNSYIYQQEFKKFYIKHNLYNDFNTSYIENRKKKYDICNEKKEKDIGEIFEYRVGLPTFAYIINKLSSRDKLDVSGFRFYNGVNYSIKKKNSKGKDIYAHIGELDILILNKENEIVAVGEIKSYFDGIIKAYKQMNRFLNILRDTDFNNIKFTYKDLNNEITNLDFISGHRIVTDDTPVDINKNTFIILKKDEIVNYIGTIENYVKFFTDLIKKSIVKIDESGKLVTDEQILSEKLEQIVVHDSDEIINPDFKKSVLDKIYYDINNRVLLLNTKEILEKYDSASNLSNILVFKENLLNTNINLSYFSEEIKKSFEKDKKEEKEKEAKIKIERRKEMKKNKKKIMKIIESAKKYEEKNSKLGDIRIQQLNQYKDQQKRNK